MAQLERMKSDENMYKSSANLVKLTEKALKRGDESVKDIEATRVEESS